MAPAPAPPPAPMRDSFFDMPVELRLKVYELLFCFPDTFVLTLDKNGLFKHKRSKGPIKEKQKVPVHVFQVNKRVYLEASPVLYRCNKFRIESAALRNDRVSSTQTVCKLLEDLEIRCVGDDLVWRYTQIVKYLGDCMPSLRKLNFTFEKSPFALIAASVEFSSTLAPCAPMFQGPTLRLCGHILRKEVNPPSPDSEEHRIYEALKADGKSLGGVSPPDNRRISLLTHSDLDLPGARLSLIQLTGKISPLLLSRIEKHTCPIGDCTWVKTHEDDNPEDASADEITTGRRTHLRWGTMDTPAPSPKEINMLQFYPEMSKRDQEIFQDFLESYNRTETSMKNGGEASEQPQPTKRQRTSQHVSEATSTDTGGEDEKTANDDDTTSWPSTATNASTTLAANPDEHLHSFGTLTLADYSIDDDFTDEDTHWTSNEINAAWDEQFGSFGSNSGVGSSGDQSNTNQSGDNQSGMAADETEDKSMTE